MAIFIPEQPIDYNGSRAEEEIFESLHDLDDNYYVFHSVEWIGKNKKDINAQGECDFIILDKNNGLMILEAKAGNIWCEDGEWYQQNTYTKKTFKIVSPFTQANKNKFHILNIIKSNFSKNILVCHAVWFTCGLANRNELPPNCDSDILLDANSIKYARADIEKAFIFWKKRFGGSILTDTDITKIVNIIAPNLHIVPTLQSKIEVSNQKFIKLTNQQIGILDFLDEQNDAAIRGGAGTGKTLIALEKAKRLAENGQNVIFLCYNNALKAHLCTLDVSNNIKFETFHSLALKYVKLNEHNFDILETEFLQLLFDDENLIFENVIIDECQDFKNDWIEYLKLKCKNCFYTFYDHNQSTCQDYLPEYLINADCRLTLHMNCRNTQEVARTAYRSLGLPIKISSNQPSGIKTKLYNCNDDSTLKRTIDNSLSDHIDTNKVNANDIVILTMETIETSNLSSFSTRTNSAQIIQFDSQQVQFTTVRKFKGLESNIVYLIDVDLNKADSRDWLKLFYIGSSRAKFELRIFFDKITDVTLSKAIKIFGQSDFIIVSKKSFAKLLSAEWA